jgi:hypothetical protein
MNIAAMIDEAAPVLFGRHVLWRADYQTALCLGAGTYDLRDTEVRYLDHALARNQQVGGLDVTMDYTLAMRVAEPGKHLLHGADGILEMQLRALLDVLIQGAAVDILHHDVRADRILVVVVEDRDDGRMIEPRHRTRLVAKSRGKLLRTDFVAALEPQDLDGHRSLERRIEGAIDSPHAADAEGIDDIVLAYTSRDHGPIATSSMPRRDCAASG